MSMCNLIEYSYNYPDTSGSLWQFKRDEVPLNNKDLTVDNSQSFKYKAALVGKAEDAVNNAVFNFWRLLEMSLTNCKVHFKLKYNS